MANKQEISSLIDPTAELEKLQRGRRRANWGWKALLFLGVLLLLEVPLPPIPPSLAFPLMLASFVGTGYLFYRARQLPLREALLVACRHKGRLSKALLCTEINIDIPTAEAVLRVLEGRHLAQIDPQAFAENNELIYKIEGYFPEEESPPRS